MQVNGLYVGLGAVLISVMLFTIPLAASVFWSARRIWGLKAPRKALVKAHLNA